jgi:hypothetical protein
MVLRLLTKKNTIWRFYVIDDALTQKKNGYLNKAFPGRVLACSALEERLTDMPMYFPIFRGNEGGILWQRQWDPAATSVHTHVLRTCHTTATRTPFTPLLLPPLFPPPAFSSDRNSMNPIRTALCRNAQVLFPTYRISLLLHLSSVLVKKYTADLLLCHTRRKATLLNQFAPPCHTANVARHSKRSSRS